MNDVNELRVQLLSSLLTFTQTFYKLRTGRDFVISQPISRESHYITICRALTRVLNGELLRLIINVPPRYGKTETLIHFNAWGLAHYPDSNFIYTSYSHSLAKKQTQAVREIVGLNQYKKLFGVEISQDTSAKDNFETIQHGSVYAVGSGGTITGRGAGIQNVKRFGGCIIIDDIHKPDEATSDTIRDGVKNWYLNTLQSRVNSPTTPIIYIGQRVHEDDLAANLIEGFDGHKWEVITLPALDIAGNALMPTMHSKEQLLIMKDKMPYEFASQYQQTPVPAGGGIYKREYFPLLEQEPKMLATFITADTAETSKTYNDPSVFSFWGLYRIEHFQKEIDMYAIHWIDCLEEWLEPKDLVSTFMQFYSQCLNHPVQPKIAAIEKKSTGSTLISAVNDIQGLRVIDIDRNVASGSKTKRFLDVQPYIASKQVSLPMFGKHTKSCLDHMVKITANDSHRYDDRADTCADAVDLGLIKKVIVASLPYSQAADAVVTQMAAFHRRQDQSRRYIYGNR